VPAAPQDLGRSFEMGFLRTTQLPESYPRRTNPISDQARKKRRV
jgi:hypothetical protein